MGRKRRHSKHFRVPHISGVTPRNNVVPTAQTELRQRAKEPITEINHQTIETSNHQTEKPNPETQSLFCLFEEVVSYLSLLCMPLFLQNMILSDKDSASIR